MGIPTDEQKKTKDKSLTLSEEWQHFIDYNRSRVAEIIKKSDAAFFIKYELSELKYKARELVNKAIPLRNYWSDSTLWLTDDQRIKFIYFYCLELDAAWNNSSSNEKQIIDMILSFENEYQLIKRKNHRIWLNNIARKAHEAELARKEQEYQEFLKYIEALEFEENKKRANRIFQVDPRQFKSSIMRLGSTVEWIPIEFIKAVTSIFLDFVPIIGQIKGIVEAISGKDIITDMKLGPWMRGLTGFISFIPFAKGTVKIGAKVARGIARGVGMLSRLSKVERAAVIAFALKQRMQLNLRLFYELYMVSSKLTPQQIRSLELITTLRDGQKITRVQQKQLVRAKQTLGILEAETSRLSRTASGVIENGRTITRTQSGTIIPKTQKAAKIPKSTSNPKSVEKLVSNGYSTIALGKLSVNIPPILAKRLLDLGDMGKDFINHFHDCYGVEKVLTDLASKSRGKINGAKLVIQYASKNPEILSKVKLDPGLIRFEWHVGKNTTKAGIKRSAREVDLVVQGNRFLKAGQTVYVELKNWTTYFLKYFGKRSLQKQITRDTAILGPKNIKWVFNSARIKNKNEVIKTFFSVIWNDPYLRKAWGGNKKSIWKFLDRVIELHPPL